MRAEPLTLTGRLVTLRPLDRADHDALVAAASDGELWNAWYTSVPRPDAMAAEIDRRLGLLDAGAMVPFTVLNTAGSPVGMTTFCNLDPTVPLAEIGYTWYGTSAHRTGLNTEAKLLLLTHAFEAWGCARVEFRTHRLNTRSRRAIERLGAQLEGVLRQHKRMPDGTLRDTVVYAILDHEWPTIRTHLRHLLAEHGTPAPA